MLIVATDVRQTTDAEKLHGRDNWLAGTHENVRRSWGDPICPRTDPGVTLDRR
jgi:hypothetical protein